MQLSRATAEKLFSCHGQQDSGWVFHGQWGMGSSLIWNCFSHKETALEGVMHGTFDSPASSRSRQNLSNETASTSGLLGLFRAASQGALSRVLLALFLELGPPRQEHCCTILCMCAWIAGISY